MIGKWNYLPLTPLQQEEAETLRKHCNDNSAVAELMIRRGIKTPQDADRFITPAISDLHDPFLMPDMDKAVNRLNKAMGAKELWSMVTMMSMAQLLWRWSINTYKTTTAILNTISRLVTKKVMVFR